NYLDILRQAGFIDDYGQHHHALQLGLACFLGVLRRDIVEHRGRLHLAPFHIGRGPRRPAHRHPARICTDGNRVAWTRFGTARFIVSPSFRGSVESGETLSLLSKRRPRKYSHPISEDHSMILRTAFLSATMG